MVTSESIESSCELDEKTQAVIERPEATIQQEQQPKEDLNNQTMKSEESKNSSDRDIN